MSVLTTTPLSSAPSGAGGVALTPATEPTWSAWVEILAATPAPIAIAGAQFAGGSGSLQTYDLDIGTGAASAEVSVGTLRMYFGNLGSTTYGPDGVLLPVPLGGIGSGVRVAVRARATSGTIAPNSVTLLYYASFSSDQVTTSTQVLSAAPASTTLTTLTPSATPWANSAWVELIASAATGLGLLGLAHALAAGASVDGSEYDLGVGAASAETVLTTLREAAYGNQRAVYTWLPGLFPVAAGSRIAVRMRKAGTTTASHGVALLYYTNVSAAAATRVQAFVWLPV